MGREQLPSGGNRGSDDRALRLGQIPYAKPVQPIAFLSSQNNVGPIPGHIRRVPQDSLLSESLVQQDSNRCSPGSHASRRASAKVSPLGLRLVNCSSQLLADCIHSYEGRVCALHSFDWLELVCSGVAGVTSRCGHLFPQVDWRCQVRQIALFLLVLALLLRAYRVQRLRMYCELTLAQPAIRSVLGQLDRLHPRLPRGTRLLAINDPLPHRYELLLLLRLYFRDGALEVDHETSNDGRHQYVIVWCGTTLYLLTDELSVH